jgi:hypothetical protein
MYLDPGVGSMIIQFAIASVAAVAAMFGIFRRNIVSFFRKSKETPDDEPENEQPDEDVENKNEK